jgi:hypothetical protein
VSISRQFIEAVTQIFDAPETALACLKPEIDLLREKEQARKIQRRGNRQSTGKPRGRPRLSPEKQAESNERRRELHRVWMRVKRARDRGL